MHGLAPLDGTDRKDIPWTPRRRPEPRPRRQAQAGITTRWNGAGLGCGAWWRSSAAGVLLVALSGCSGDPALTPVEAAQAEVAAKEEALADAEAEATATAAAFCEASATYITALDRYGDVLNETAPTVGDVKDAGTDLTAPREDTKAAGEAAVSAREQVTQAEQDLADAQAALAAAEAAVTGRDAGRGEGQPGAQPRSGSRSGDRCPRRTGRGRVRRRPGRDHRQDPPGAGDGQQFNSAAVALQMSWLVLVRRRRVPDRRPAGAGRHRRARLHHRPAAGPGRRRVLRG